MILFPFQNQNKQIHFKKTQSLAASSALLIDADIHRDDDDIFDKKIPTRDELSYFQSELEKSSDYQSKNNLPNILS